MQNNYTELPDSARRITAELLVASKPVRFEITPLALLCHQPGPLPGLTHSATGLTIMAERHEVTLFLCCPATTEEVWEAIVTNQVKAVRVMSEQAWKDHASLIRRSPDGSVVRTIGIHVVEAEPKWPAKGARVICAEAASGRLQLGQNRARGFGWSGRHVVAPNHGISFPYPGPAPEWLAIPFNTVTSVRQVEHRIVIDQDEPNPARCVVQCASTAIASDLAEDIRAHRPLALGVNEQVRSIMHTPFHGDPQAPILVAGPRGLAPEVQTLADWDGCALLNDVPEVAPKPLAQQ